MKWLLGLIVFLAACSSQPPAPSPAPIVCSMEQSMAAALAAGMASAFQCSGLSNIQGDMLAVLGKANLCAQVAPPPASVQKMSKQPMKGIVGSLVCPIVVDSVLGLVNQKIPISWSCVMSKDPGTIGALMNAACQKVVPL